MKKVLKVLALVIVAIPVFVVGQCMYDQVTDRRELVALCEGAKTGSSVAAFLESGTKNSRFKVRTGGAAGKSDAEWFDREYLRIGERLKRQNKLADDYSIVFAKPGIGYFACIAIHRDGAISRAWFEDRSD